MDAVVGRLPDLIDDPILIGRMDPVRGGATVLWVNDALVDAFGYTKDDIVGGHSRILYAPDQPRHRLPSLDPDAPESDAFRGELRCARKDGTVFWADVSVRAMTTDDGPLLVKVFRNVDRLRQREDEAEAALGERDRLVASLREAHARMVSAINTFPDPFALFDKTNTLLFFNSAYQESWTAGREPLRVGMHFDDIMRVAVKHGILSTEDDDLKRFIEHAERTWTELQGEVDVVVGKRHYRVFRQVAPNGDRVVLRLDITAMKNQTRQLESYARELEAAKAKIEQQAVRDSLTQIGNRRYLRGRLAELLDQRGEGREVALLQVDLDGFKQINDTVGHGAGDHVLKEVARILSDIAEPDAAVARMGGDEFVLALAVSRESEAMDVAERIVQSLSHPVDYHGHPCRFGASVGIATTPVGGTDSEALMRNSDFALYRAKRAGKSRAYAFKGPLCAETPIKSLQEDLAKALQEGEIKAAYVPQVCARTMAVTGVEVQAVWHKGGRTAVSLESVLPVADTSEAFLAIDRWLFTTALEEAARLREEGVLIPRVALPACPRRLEALADSVAARIAKSPTKVAFRLSADLLSDGRDVFPFTACTTLKRAGAQLDMTGFDGTSLPIADLSRVSPERLVLDRSVVATVAQTPKAPSVIKSIQQAGDVLGIAIAADGVETPAQAFMLRDIGIAHLQGVSFGAPMERDALAKAIRGGRCRQDLTMVDGGERLRLSA
ncbi:MAG: diguanylate cyclase [Pseudomonadota bacterium]